MGNVSSSDNTSHTSTTCTRSNTERKKSHYHVASDHHRFTDRRQQYINYSISEDPITDRRQQNIASNFHDRQQQLYRNIDCNANAMSSPSSSSFAGAKCLVVGATDHQSIGYACALSLVKAGARVCIMGRDETTLHMAVQDLQAAVPGVSPTCGPFEACAVDDPLRQSDTMAEMFGSAFKGCLDGGYHTNATSEETPLNESVDSDGTLPTLQPPPSPPKAKEASPYSPSSSPNLRPATYVTGIVGDLWKPEAMPVLLQRVVERRLNDGLDILIISAGNGVEYTNLDPNDVQSYKYSMNIAVLSPQFLINAAAPYLSNSNRPGGGAVVVVGSSDSTIPLPEMAPYNYSRAAQNTMVQTLAFRYRRDNIRINGVLPSCIHTGALDAMATKKDMPVEEYSQLRAEENPMGMVGTPEHVADTVVFLASAGSSYMTGELLKIDGGSHLSSWRNYPKRNEQKEHDEEGHAYLGWLQFKAADDTLAEERTTVDQTIEVTKSGVMEDIVGPDVSKGIEDIVGPEVSKSIDELVVKSSDTFVKIVDDVAKAVEDIGKTEAERVG